ncbi:hypothetical protein [Actinomadura logoneensis]|nr:hypothetical protein [Actinomadura logoneensis]
MTAPTDAATAVGVTDAVTVADARERAQEGGVRTRRMTPGSTETV